MGEESALDVVCRISKTLMYETSSLPGIMVLTFYEMKDVYRS